MTQSDSLRRKKSSKRFFTPPEDEIIKHHYHELGITDWNIISTFLIDRTPKNCRDRYINFLKPNIIQNPWNPEEEDLFLRLILKFGKRWTHISSFMNHRSPGNLKNRWNNHLKKKIGKELIKLIPSKQQFRVASFHLLKDLKKFQPRLIWEEDDIFFKPIEEFLKEYS
jgi:hypothetical protein